MDTNKPIYSKYFDYLLERENLQVYDAHYGFALFKVLPTEGVLYLQDVYIEPEKRQIGVCGAIVRHMLKAAKTQGLNGIVTTVSPEGINSSLSMLAALKLGFKIKSSEKDVIYLYLPVSDVGLEKA